jgi:hypothetical protein
MLGKCLLGRRQICSTLKPCLNEDAKTAKHLEELGKDGLFHSFLEKKHDEKWWWINCCGLKI